MGKVHLLPENVISKIAAGEVIERPASVVKELMENSLDAGAQSIELTLEEAGKTLITLKDDGEGIAQDDLEKIFHRHATSKIKTGDDLYNIHSLGFRGEALYAVAAISDISLKSKTASQDSAFEVHLRGGKKLGSKPCAFGEHGTVITIKELFFNTPARKKFLKTDTTEMNQILNVFIPYTLFHHDRRFNLTHNGNDLIDTAPAKNRMSRMAEILNLEEKYLLTSQYASLDEEIRVEIVLGDMNIQRRRRDMQYIFVNGRPVENKSISFHLNQIYRLVMPDDSFGCFAVYIDVNPQEVDVNIHPTKREVKLKNERVLCNVLRSLAEETLMKSGQVKEVKLEDETTPAPSNFFHKDVTHSEKIYSDSGFEEKTEIFSGDYAFPRRDQKPAQFYIPNTDIFHGGQKSLQKKVENARYIGSFINKFLLFEGEGNLLIVDQHAAAERITYEQLIRQMQKSQLEVQNLLSPVVIKLSPSEMLIYKEVAQTLKLMGMDNNQWDDESIAIHTQPLALKNIETAVRQVLSGEKIEKNDFATMARRACRSSVMAGDRLNPQEAEFLREQLLQCLDPYTCPHGRPTIIEMSEDFLNKQFFRT